MTREEQRYEKVQLHWDWSVTELKTDIPVTDWQDPTKSYVHTIHSIKATALPDQKGKIFIDFRRVSVSPNKDVRSVFCDRLETGLNQYCEQRGSSSSGIDWVRLTSGKKDYECFELEFKLHQEHYFSESVIPLVKHILDLFGVDDQGNFRITDFELTQATMLRFEDTWITYPNWLRIMNRLPVLNA